MPPDVRTKLVEAMQRRTDGLENDDVRREGWGIDIDAKRLTWMTWAGDNIPIARDAAAMTRMWSEATRLINTAGFTVDAQQTKRSAVCGRRRGRNCAEQRRAVSARSRYSALPSDEEQTTQRQEPEAAQPRRQDTAAGRCCKEGQEQRGKDYTPNTPRWDQSCSMAYHKTA